MKRIKNHFFKNGLKYVLLERTEKVAFFGIKGEYTDKIITYEVDRIYYTKPNKFFPDGGEYLCSNERFGKEGSLHIPNYEMAQKYFVGLNNLILVNDKDKKLMVYIKKLQSDLAGS